MRYEDALVRFSEIKKAGGVPDIPQKEKPNLPKAISEVAPKVEKAIDERIARLEAQINALQSALIKAIKNIDVSPVVNAPEVNIPETKSVDLSPILDAINSINFPAAEAPKKQKYTFKVVRNREGLIDTIEAR